MATTKTRNVHAESLAISSTIAGYYVKNMIPPLDVIRVLLGCGKVLPLPLDASLDHRGPSTRAAPGADRATRVSQSRPASRKA